MPGSRESLVFGLNSNRLTETITGGTTGGGTVNYYYYNDDQLTTETGAFTGSNSYSTTYTYKKRMKRGRS